jgi:dCTP diphosphatase
MYAIPALKGRAILNRAYGTLITAREKSSEASRLHSLAAPADYGNLYSGGSMLNDNDTTMAALRGEMAEFVRQRDWEQFHDPKNLSIAIATEAAELMEHFRWVKNDDSRELVKDSAKLGEVREELADIMAFALSFANACNIDITTAMRDKMIKNARKYPVEHYKGRY